MSPSPNLDSQYDLVFTHDALPSVGVMLYRGQDKPGATKAAEVPSSWNVGDATQQIIQRDVPKLQADFGGGAGYAKPVPGITTGYSYGTSDNIAGGPGIWCRTPRVVMNAGAVTAVALPGTATQFITKIIRFDGDLYLLCGRYVFKIPNGNGVPALEKDLGVGFVASGATEFNGDLYVGGSGGNIWKLDASGGTWTQSVDVVRSLPVTVYWVVGGVGLFEMVAQSAAGTFSYCSGNPMLLANWSSDIAVGSSANSITQIVAGPRHVYFLTPRGVFDVDSRGYSPNLTPYWDRLYDLNSSTEVGLIHDGYLYASHSEILDRVSITNLIEGNETPDQCTPGADAPNLTPVQGIIVALCPGVGGWINAWIYNPRTGYSYLAAGKQRASLYASTSFTGSAQGPGPLLWHFSEWDRVGPVTACLVDTAADGVTRLWAASWTGAAPSLEWQSQPPSGNPYADWLNAGTHTFGARGTLYMTENDWDDDAALKITRRHDIRSENLAPGRSILLEASADRAAWSTQGTAQSSPRASFQPTAATEGYILGRRLTLASTSTQPAILYSVKTRASVIPDLFRTLDLTIAFGHGVPLRKGTDLRDPVETLQLIEAMQAAGVVTFTDQFGNSYDAEVEPGIQELAREAQPGLWMVVTRVSVTLRSEAFGHIMVYDVNPWGAGFVYGSDS